MFGATKKANFFNLFIQIGALGIYWRNYRYPSRPAVGLNSTAVISMFFRGIATGRWVSKYPWHQKQLQWDLLVGPLYVAYYLLLPLMKYSVCISVTGLRYRKWTVPSIRKDYALVLFGDFGLFYFFFPFLVIKDLGGIRQPL